MLFVNWELGGSAAGQCVTGVGHKVQLPLGPSTRLCLETVRYEPGRNVQPPLGPSTGRLSEKLGFGGPKPSPGRGWLAQRDGCGAVQLTWFRPSSAPVCALGHLPPGEGISPTNPNLAGGKKGVTIRHAFILSCLMNNACLKSVLYASRRNARRQLGLGKSFFPRPVPCLISRPSGQSP